MRADQRLRQIRQIFDGGRTRSVPELLCTTSADVVEVSGAGIAVHSGAQTWPVCASNSMVAELEQLQFVLGEGPAVDAFRFGVAISEPELASPDGSRWVSFVPPALQVGLAAVFSFPLPVGTISLGTLTFYSQSPGPLAEDQRADALLVASVVTDSILDGQSRNGHHGFVDELATRSNYRAEVHQASGMVAVQLGIGVDESLVRLRATAFAEGVPLEKMAGDVIHRRRRFEP